MGYDHRQKAFLPWVLWLIAAACLTSIWWVPPSDVWVQILLIVLGVSFAMLGLVFGHLRVRDDQTHLRVQFGPLPLVGCSIAYEQIRGFAAERSGLIDGWGVHYHPVKGWIYNIQGLDCMRLDLGEKSFRVGTDDVAGLTRLLQEKCRAAT